MTSGVIMKEYWSRSLDFSLSLSFWSQVFDEKSERHKDQNLFFYQLLNLFAQLRSINSAEVLIDEYTFIAEEKCRR